ncbi:Target SNARE coiled-coil homology domain [Dillenia turbinata]|uniref:Target SNARE coiled-coil homology domain n=1 Tax=Dillenia turbinata TaxID=194707 RepID=A0AAN8UJB0_9MAGN
MTTRNRTILYRKYRDALKTVRVTTTFSYSSSPPSSSSAPVIELVNSSLLNPRRSYKPLSTHDPAHFSIVTKECSFPSKGAPTVGLPPDWVDVSEDIAANVQCAQAKVSELVKVHAKALMPSFGDGKEDQCRIEALTQEITDILRKSEKKLKRLSVSGPSEDSNIRKNVQRSLATDLQNLSVELRKKQSAYLKRLKQQKEGRDGVDLEMDLNRDRSKQVDDDFNDLGFSEHEMIRIKQSEAFTVAREKEIQQVAESVNELAQIMKDLSILVIDQGTIVDRIDYNIQSVATTVEEGLKQLQKAEKSHREGKMVKCATVLVIMCFVMLVLLVLKEIF